jgi:NAD(P)-dependent dehydrogenase (short-subunit alcohol dehydrogenase family)
VPNTWVITGSSRALGRALAKAALAAGEKVAATARRVDDLQDLKDRYRDQVLLLPLDVTSETQAIEAVMSTIRTFGRLDVLVNNAVYGNVAPVEDTTLEECRAIVLSCSLPPNLLWLRRMRRGARFDYQISRV